MRVAIRKAHSLTGPMVKYRAAWPTIRRDNYLIVNIGGDVYVDEVGPNFSFITIFPYGVLRMMVKTLLSKTFHA